MELSGLDAIAVTQGPGLVGALLVGVQVAKGLAFAQGKPLVPVHHIAGHIEAPFLAHGDVPLPALALVVSGGHTSLYEVPVARDLPPRGPHARRRGGRSLRQGGEAPGPRLPGRTRSWTGLADGANDAAVEFAVAKMSDGRPDFSFSGLKTAVLLPREARRGSPKVDDPAERVRPRVRDLLASFQRAVVTALLRGLTRAARELGPRSLLLTGGVAANSLLLREEARAAAASWACLSSCRPWTSPPTTPP